MGLSSNRHHYGVKHATNVSGKSSRRKHKEAARGGLGESSACNANLSSSEKGRKGGGGERRKGERVEEP